jgi:hypothetical protein
MDITTAPMVDFNESTGRYELSLCLEDLQAVYAVLQANADVDPGGLVAGVVGQLEDEGIESEWSAE